MAQQVLLDSADDARISAAGLDRLGVERLLERAGQEVVAAGLPAAQIALARDGAVVFTANFGASPPDALYSVFSATKAVTAAAVWRLLDAGELREDERVSSIIPAFSSNGKDAVTVEQLLTHTAGFPHAPFRPLDWLDAERRSARWRQWRLSWAPGSRYEYHPTSSMWVLAEIIERRSGRAFTEFVRDEVLDPLGLSDLYLGSPLPRNDRVVPCALVGVPLTAADYARLDLPEPPITEVTEAAIESFNDPVIRAVGVPGGGAVTSAADLARFWQALLHGGSGGRSLWSAALRAAVTRVRTGEFRDPVHGRLANRGLGVVIAGDDTRIWRGFGRNNGKAAFGHNGAGGQIAWADPSTGLSFAFLTGGHDRNTVREAARGVALSTLAALCAGRGASRKAID
jgi:CubicO group peptidase (beta-lactamase class C family)